MNGEQNEFRMQNGTGEERNATASAYIGSGQNTLSVSTLSPKEQNNAFASAPRKKPKKKLLSSLVSAVIAVVGVVTLGVVSADLVAPPVEAHVELYPFETGVSFYAELPEDYTPRDEVRVLVYNDFTNRTWTAKAGEEWMQEEMRAGILHGYFEDLAPQMSYTFEIRDGSRTLTQQKFRTVDSRANDLPAIEAYLQFFIYDTGVSYFVELLDYTATDALTAIVYSDALGLYREQPMPDGMIEASEEDLTPLEIYTFEVRDGSRVLLSRTFRAVSAEMKITPEARSVSYTLVLENYTPSGALTASVCTAEGKVAEQTLDQSAQGYLGSLPGLTPQTDYTLEIREGSVLLYTEMFYTPEESADSGDLTGQG